MTNSEDLEEILHKRLFIGVYTVHILGQIRSPEKEMKYFLWNPSIYKMGRPDLTVQTLWTIPLIYNLVLIAHAQMPLINAHVYVSKVRYSMGHFDSEYTGGITSESALFSMTI